MKKSAKINILLDYLLSTLGAIIAAFAIEEFLVPCTILDGGIVGIGIMVNNLTGLRLSILTICLNIPFLLIGSQRLGKHFITRSAYAMTVFSIFLGIFETFTNATSEYLLAVCFGGVILGIGVGLVIRSGGCLDGTEAIAIMLNRRFSLPVGQIVLTINIVIFSIAALLFGFDRAMYSLLTYFIASKVIDTVENGMNQTKAAFIITNDAAEIADQIYRRLGRTVTLMEGEGLVSGPKVVVYCVLTHFEVYELKAIISEIDSSAFITVSDVAEVIGTHVKKTVDLDRLSAETTDTDPTVSSKS